MTEPTALLTAIAILAIGGAQVVLSGSAKAMRLLHADLAGLLREAGVEFADAPDRIRVLDGTIRFETLNDSHDMTITLRNEDASESAG
jgi:hypothetical protein